jgi:hypothetical protein
VSVALVVLLCALSAFAGGLAVTMSFCEVVGELLAQAHEQECAERVPFVGAMHRAVVALVSVLLLPAGGLAFQARLRLSHEGLVLVRPERVWCRRCGGRAQPPSDSGGAA